MWYVIIGRDAQDSLAARSAHRPEHLARLESLKQLGRLLVAGPMPAIDAEDPGAAGFVGSLIIAEFASLDEASSWAAADPYLACGAYASIEVQPFRRVLP